MRFSFKKLCRLTFNDWRESSPGLLAGALAYFASISLPPLVIVLGAVLEHFVGRREVFFQLHETVGAKATQAALHWVNLARQNRTPSRTLWSVVLLAVVASRVFAHLQTVYRVIWRESVVERGLRQGLLKHTIVPFFLVLSSGLFTLAFLLLVPVTDALGQVVRYRGVVPFQVGHILNFFLSLALFTFLFGALNKGLSRVELRWSDVLPGALVTALLFAAARGALILYVAIKSFHSVYGAAGSVVLMMVWIYFAAHIFVIGAVFTRRYVLVTRGR